MQTREQVLRDLQTKLSEIWASLCVRHTTQLAAVLIDNLGLKEGVGNELIRQYHLANSAISVLLQPNIKDTDIVNSNTFLIETAIAYMSEVVEHPDSYFKEKGRLINRSIDVVAQGRLKTSLLGLGQINRGVLRVVDATQSNPTVTKANDGTSTSSAQVTTRLRTEIANDPGLLSTPGVGDDESNSSSRSSRSRRSSSSQSGYDSDETVSSLSSSSSNASSASSVSDHLYVSNPALKAHILLWSQLTEAAHISKETSGAQATSGEQHKHPAEFDRMLSLLNEDVKYIRDGFANQIRVEALAGGQNEKWIFGQNTMMNTNSVCKSILDINTSMARIDDTVKSVSKELKDTKNLSRATTDAALANINHEVIKIKNAIDIIKSNSDTNAWLFDAASGEPETQEQSAFKSELRYFVAKLETKMANIQTELYVASPVTYNAPLAGR